MRLLLALSIVVVCASAASAGPEDVANRLSNEIMSPFCPGVTLHDCPSGQADDLRAQIRSWSGQGWSEDKIMNELIDEYGPSISAFPPSGSGGVASWLVPALVVAAASVVAASLARRWRGAPKIPDDPEAPTEVPPELTAEQKARLEAELAAHEARMTGSTARPSW